MHNFEEMFTDPGWKTFRRPPSPNRFYYHPNKRLAAVVLERSSQYDEFALSRHSLDYLLEAQVKGEKIDGAFVVLRERDNGPIVGAEAVRKIDEKLRNAPVKQGKSGPYWWIDQSLVEDDPLM